MHNLAPRHIQSRASLLANWLSLCWIFFSIGAWRASTIASVAGNTDTEPLILFSGVFAVWFCSYISCIVLGLFYEGKILPELRQLSHASGE